MTTIKGLTDAILEKVAGCDEHDLQVLKQFNLILEEKIKSRHGFHELIKELVPDYKKEFCWDGDTSLITDVKLERQYFSNYGDVEYLPY